MASPERSELEARAAALRRIVYGTPGGHLGEAASELEAVEAELRRAVAMGGSHEAPAALIASPTDEGRRAGWLAVVEQVEQVEQDARAPGAPRGTRRRALVMVAVAAVIAVVAVLGPLRELAEPPRGLEVFDRAPDPSQALIPGQDDILAPEALASVRFIGSEVGYDAWVFRDRDDVCMALQRENWNGAGITCVTEAEFARAGIRQVVRYEQLYDLVRPVGVGPGDGVEFAWTTDSTELEWSTRR
ncbi:hypothetical protein [Agromyces sp. PvR057]|uniref:hypothetical protein n=1 Tax=Agromyces sp. PvR057 TaxID=3156403 RepID=UPI000E225637